MRRMAAHRRELRSRNAATLSPQLVAVVLHRPTLVGPSGNCLHEGAAPQARTHQNIIKCRICIATISQMSAAVGPPGGAPPGGPGVTGTTGPAVHVEEAWPVPASRSPGSFLLL